MVAAAVKTQLEQNGFKPVVFHPDGVCNASGYYANLQERVDFANSNNASVFVSIHADSGQQSDSFNPIYSTKGPFSAESKKLADLMGSSTVASLQASGKSVTTSTTDSLKTG